MIYSFYYKSYTHHKPLNQLQRITSVFPQNKILFRVETIELIPSEQLHKSINVQVMKALSKLKSVYRKSKKVKNVYGDKYNDAISVFLNIIDSKFSQKILSKLRYIFRGIAIILCSVPEYKFSVLKLN